MMKYAALLLVCASLLLPMGGRADETAPDVLVKQVTNEVLDIVRMDKEIQSGSTKWAIELVEQQVLPHFNFTRMTALAVGRDWRKASPAQQQALIDEFRTLLMRTYSNALIAYRNQTVAYKPFRMQPGETDVTVRTQINQPSGKSITLDYSLEKQAQGWKVYDVIVGGVSLVTNYRESFSTEVRNGSIDSLVQSLQAKNRSLETSAAGRAEKK